jgi:hypothetical protein
MVFLYDRFLAIHRRLKSNGFISYVHHFSGYKYIYLFRACRLHINNPNSNINHNKLIPFRYIPYIQYRESSGGLRAVQLGFDSRQGQKIIFFSIAPRRALGPTLPPIQWVPESLSRGGKAAVAQRWTLEKVKLSLYRPRSSLGLREYEAPIFSDIRLTDGGEVVNLVRRPLFNPRKIPGTHFG